MDTKRYRQTVAMLEALQVSKSYTQGRWHSRHKFLVTAVDKVSIKLDACSTLALVGESGAGKSTLGRCLSGLEKPDSGKVLFEDQDLMALSSKDRSAVRSKIQFVFQDSAAALNPRFSALQAIEEPALIQKSLPRNQRLHHAIDMMEQVGIAASNARRSVLAFSGGQRQRLAIARALILSPRVLILDESLSGVDADTRARLTELLRALQVRLKLSYLLITHDLRLAAQMADRIAVMRAGAIVESGDMATLFFQPCHAYTKSLLHTMPVDLS